MVKLTGHVSQCLKYVFSLSPWVLQKFVNEFRQSLCVSPHSVKHSVECCPFPRSFDLEDVVDIILRQKQRCD